MLVVSQLAIHGSTVYVHIYHEDNLKILKPISGHLPPIIIMLRMYVAT